MTTDELKTLLDTITTDLNAVADYAGIVDPALIPFIAIGKAVDKQIPGLVAGVANWIAGNPPTDAEKKALLDQLSVLGNPDLP